MRRIKNIYFILFFFFAGVDLFSQNYFFRNYSVEDGLPFIQVATIYQDSKGNLWSGGYGGLSKFDGISFVNYTPKEGLLNHSVTAIAEDNAGNIWVGTISGINKFDGKKFTSYTTKHGLINNHITCALKDKKGNLWFGTKNGISKLTDATFINFSADNGLVSNEINCIYQTADEKIWIGTSKGISVYDNQKFINYSLKNGLPNNIINGIAEDAEHNIWIATPNGLIKFQNNKAQVFNKKNGLADDVITDVWFANNVVWVGTNKGISKIKDNKIESYAIRKDQNSNIVHCLYSDFENNLWIGTYAGLFRYRGNPFVSYGIHDGLTNNFIFGITRDSKGVLWVGSQGGGLYKYYKGEFEQINQQNGIQVTTVNAIFEYMPNHLWLATDIGLVEYDGKNFSKKKDTSTVFKNNLNCFFIDSKNNIWIGGDNEIYEYDGEKFSCFKPQARSSDYQVWTITEDKQGNIWFGTYLGGLIKYDGKTFEECSQKIGLSNDSYLASLVDKAGNLYLASLDGLWIYNSSANNPLVHFDKTNGLSSDLIYSMAFDKAQKNIWLGTNQGINKIDIETFFKTNDKKCIAFGKAEGFSGVECNSNGTWVDEDGVIWFGTVYGLVKYNPSEYIPNTAESKIDITKIRLFYNDTLLENKAHLTYDLNNITFIFNGISLTNPEKVMYSHILEGFDNAWSPPVKERFANYSNLPPGTYTFKVISSNNEGVWNQQPATFTFTIDRPFWKTPAFLFGISLILVVALVVSIRFRINNIKDKEKRKTEINKKIAHLESQALRAQMNPHFIFNTLSSIQHYISNNDTDAALKYLSKFAKLMRKIMDNSKQQMISVAEEVNALDLYLELEVMRFAKKFEYKIIVDKAIDQNYDRIPSMLIQPYVENAIIHGLLPKDGEGKILIVMEKQGETILCTIEDNGIGREKSKEFKKNRVQQHKSMGMSITQERLDILNSSLKSNLNAEILDLYEDGKPSGTKVRLIIPLDTSED